MNPIHEQFVAEARELVLQTNDDLITLERDGFDSGCVDRIMRSFHTLKGSAGVVQLPAMGLALHAAEDLMIAVQRGQVFPTNAVISAALRCVDKVSQWVDAFEQTGELPQKAAEDARDIAEHLRNQILGKAAAGASFDRTAEIPDWASRLVKASGRKALEPGSSAPLFAVLYEPHAGCFYDGDDPLSLLRKTPNLLALNIEFFGQGDPLADFDPFSCKLRLEALAAGDRDQLAAIFKNVPDQVRIINVPLELVSGVDGRSNAAANFLRSVIEEQSEMLRATTGSENLIGCMGAAAGAASNALRYASHGVLAERVVAAGVTANANRDPAALIVVLGKVLEELDRDEQSDNPPPLPAGKKSVENESVASRTLRVDESRVESLVNLAGELIVLKNSLGHLAKRIEAEKGGQDLIQAARHEYDRIERLADEMQTAILQLRMVPFAQVLRAFPRLVRDLSQQLGKKVNLVTQGETTDCDKAIVDRLFEPLLHLVRNALDHGIESPERRIAAGKDAAAKLTIQASRAGDRVVVEVTDDGAGIDPEIVRRKAIEKGLLTAEKAASVPDENLLELIFSAGFSTARQASDVSGRGVGMDVVRTTVEQIGGRVTVDSRVGQGTTVRLDVPMNIATSRIMVVECAGQTFGIPMDHVSETVRLTSDQISEVKNNEGFVLRDRVMPICSLAELLNLPEEPRRKDGARLVIVAEAGGRTAAVEIDAIRDRMDVVLKPMQGLLAQARGYAGTTLLGDGAVLLVVDLKEVLP